MMRYYFIVCLFSISCTNASNEIKESKNSGVMKMNLSALLDGTWISTGLYQNITDKVIKYPREYEEGIIIKYDSVGSIIKLIYIMDESRGKFNFKIDTVVYQNGILKIYSKNKEILNYNILDQNLHLDSLPSPFARNVPLWRKYSFNQMDHIVDLRGFIIYESLFKKQYELKFDTLENTQSVEAISYPGALSLQYQDGKNIYLDFSDFIVDSVGNKKMVFRLTYSNKIYLRDTYSYYAEFLNDGIIKFYRTSTNRIRLNVSNIKSKKLIFTLTPYKNTVISG